MYSEFSTVLSICKYQLMFISSQEDLAMGQYSTKTFILLNYEKFFSYGYFGYASKAKYIYNGNVSSSGIRKE